MSQHNVELVIGKLMTDQELRRRFLESPLVVLGELCERGLELHSDEIEALIRTDRRVWSWSARQIHPRLQRCSLRTP